VPLVMDNAWRHGSKSNTRPISQCRSISYRTYPMGTLMKQGLHLARQHKLPHGKGMTSMNTNSTQRRRTRRARHRIVGFDMRASDSTGLTRTLGRLKTYENLTMVVNYS